jgi:hypothetical protein
MNKRIKEHGEKAGFVFDEYNFATQRKVELLAELIVEDCLEIVSQDCFPVTAGDWVNQDAWNSYLRQRVKNYFGVIE